MGIYQGEYIMVKVELSYNPYKLETKVLFNGREPRINSLVEKYQKSMLQEWVEQLPGIFYDEMNGYDFELEFTGTELDFQDVVKSFSCAGITEDMVRIVHKKKFEERGIKERKISELGKWLYENHNHRFDYAMFWSQNSELFKRNYSVLIIDPDQIISKVTLDIPDVKIKCVSNLQEGIFEELHNVPVLLMTSEYERKEIQLVLKRIWEHKEVCENQLFFVVIDESNVGKVKRTLMGLGIDNPQFVRETDNLLVLKYIDLYPRSEYIRDAIKLFRKYSDEIEKSLETEKRNIEIINENNYKQIGGLEEIIVRLKKSNDFFLNDRSNITTPYKWDEELQKILVEIRKWKWKKDELIGEKDGEKAAREYKKNIKLWCDDFLKLVTISVRKMNEDIKAKYIRWYCEADVNVDFRKEISQEAYEIPAIPEMPLFVSDFMSMKEFRSVEHKQSAFGKVFKSSAQNSNKCISEVYFSCQQWRKCAEGKIKPYLREFMKECIGMQREYENRIAVKCIEKLEEMTGKISSQQNAIKREILNSEKKIKNDKDWLNTFWSKIIDIEEG